MPRRYNVTMSSLVGKSIIRLSAKLMLTYAFMEMSIYYYTSLENESSLFLPRMNLGKKLFSDIPRFKRSGNF